MIVTKTVTMIMHDEGNEYDFEQPESPNLLHASQRLSGELSPAETTVLESQHLPARNCHCYIMIIMISKMVMKMRRWRMVIKMRRRRKRMFKKGIFPL